MRRAISGATRVAGVAGRPIAQSPSPHLHNAWLGAAKIDAVYVAFAPALTGFAAFIDGLRGRVISGLNVTAPFKEEALALADTASERARQAGAANLLVFGVDGAIAADNTDGEGLLAAFAEQAASFDPAAGPVTILGAGGAARGAAAALLAAGSPGLRIVNRTLGRAEALADVLGERARAFAADRLGEALEGAQALINATTLGGDGPPAPFEPLGPAAVVMDMVYRPVRTAFLGRAEARGLRTVDGLAMLIGQARPSFERLFGRPPPPIDARAIALAAMSDEP